MGTPLQLTNCFSLVAFKILSLSLTFGILIMMCLGMGLFASILSGTLFASWTCMSIFLQIQEAQKVPNKMDAKRPIPRHIIIKMPKVKDKQRILKAPREKQSVTYRGVPIRLSADLSKATLQGRRDWQEIFKVMKSRNLQPRLLSSAKLHLELKGR